MNSRRREQAHLSKERSVPPSRSFKREPIGKPCSQHLEATVTHTKPHLTLLQRKELSSMKNGERKSIFTVAPLGPSREWQRLERLRNGFQVEIDESEEKYGVEEVYKGGWKDNQRHGYGELKDSKKQSCYRGYFRKGKKHGKGTVWRHTPKTKAFQKYFCGNFKEGLRHGCGRLSLAERCEPAPSSQEHKQEAGDIERIIEYEGDFVEGEKEGRGKALLANGSTYEGEFAKGQLTGFGKMKWKNGNYFEGEFRGSKRNGRGVLKFYNQESKVYDKVYRGFWKDDHPLFGAYEESEEVEKKTMPKLALRNPDQLLCELTL